jgi:PAS domain-containing protein
MSLPLLDRVLKPFRHSPRQPAQSGFSSGASLMAQTRRELSLLSAELLGAQSYLGQFGLDAGGLRGSRKLFRDLIEAAAEPYMVIDPRPGLHIVDINDAFAAATLARRRKVSGGKLFDVYPGRPDDRGADGVGNLFESIQRAAQTGRPHAMAVQRYDVRDGFGRFIEKYWQPVHIPLFDEAGRLVFVLHRSIDRTPSQIPAESEAGAAS